MPAIKKQRNEKKMRQKSHVVIILATPKSEIPCVSFLFIHKGTLVTAFYALLFKNILKIFCSFDRNRTRVTAMTDDEQIMMNQLSYFLVNLAYDLVNAVNAKVRLSERAVGLSCPSQMNAGPPNLLHTLYYSTCKVLTLCLVDFSWST